MTLAELRETVDVLEALLDAVDGETLGNEESDRHLDDVCGWARTRADALKREVAIIEAATLVEVRPQ